MTDKTQELNRIKQDIRSLLLSTPKGYTMNLLERDYRNMLGKTIPYERFGYSDLEQFLNSLPDVVQMQFCQYPRGYILTGVADATTQHIQKLVSKQKNSVSGYFDPYKDLERSGGVFRNSTNRVLLNRQTFNNKYSWTRNYNANTGRAPKCPYIPPRLRTVPFNEQLHVKELINSYPEGLRIGRFEMAYTRKFGVGFRPAEYGFPSIKEFLASVPSIVTLIPDRQSYIVYPAKPTEVRKPSPPPPPPPPAKSTCRPEPVKKEETTGSGGSLKTNLKRVLAHFPGGLLLNRLLIEYERIIKETLNYNVYGFHSPLELVGELNDVFYMERLGTEGDWLLFDASKPPPPKVVKAQEVQKPPQKITPTSISSKIKANIETVLLGHPDGIRVDQFQSVYKRNYNEELLFEELGYDSIINFFLALNSSVQLLPCKSGNVIVTSKTKTVIEDKIPGYPSDPVLPGRDYSYQTVTVENKYIEVITSQLNNPGDIWIQLRGMDTTEELELLMTELEKVYSKDNGIQYVIPDDYLKVSMVCAVVWPEDKNWHRGKVTAILSDTMVEIQYVDYGSVCKVERKLLRFLRKNFLMLPAQAIHARLSNLEPVGKDWSLESRSQLIKMCDSKALLAYVTSTTYKNTVSVLLVDTTDGEKDVNINVVLHDAKLARHSKDDDSELASPNSYVQPQSAPLSPSIGLADLSYQMQLQMQMQREYWAQMNYMLSCAGMNPQTFTQSVTEDKGIDSSVLQKMIAMGAAKPLEVDSKRSTLNIHIPTQPENIFTSNSSSPDSGAENITVKSYDTARNSGACGLNMPDVIQISCEPQEHKLHRYSQVISLSDYDVHLINYKGNPYMTSGDISVIIWGIDVLKKVLKVKQIKCPSITVYKKDEADLFEDLEKNNVKVLPDGPSVHLFPLESVKEIIAIFHKDSGNIVLQLEQLRKNFNSLDSYWTKLKGDLDTVQDEMSLEKRLHDLIQKRLKLLQDMIQTPKGDGVCIIELQEVEEKIKQVEAEIRGDAPEENIKESLDSEKKPLINTMPVSNQSTANTHLGIPIRQIQPVRPTVNQRIASLPLMPQNNSLPFQLPLISMVPSMPFPPGMCYTLPYGLQQNAYLPQNVVPQNISRNPGSWSTNN